MSRSIIAVVVMENWCRCIKYTHMYILVYLTTHLSSMCKNNNIFCRCQRCHKLQNMSLRVTL